MSIKEIKVSYYLFNEQQERLQKILAEWNKRQETTNGEQDTEESLFDFMMMCGSADDINRRFSAMEHQLGIDKPL